jgi:hypothetical protein
MNPCWWHCWHFFPGKFWEYKQVPCKSRCRYETTKLVKVYYYECCRCGKRKEKKA